MATGDMRVQQQQSSGTWQDVGIGSTTSKIMGTDKNGNPVMRQFGAGVLGSAIDQSVASSNSDIAITINSDKYLITDAYVEFGTGSSSLALLASGLRSASAGGGTLLGSFAVNAGLTASNTITKLTSLVTSATRTETTLYWRITTGVASGVASVYIIGVPITIL